MMVLIALLWVTMPAGRAAVRKLVTVKGSEFSKEHLIKLARRELAGSADSFVQVNFLADGSGPPLPKPSHIDFEYWRGMLEGSARQRTQVAEAISINGNEVLRIHQLDGSVTREVLSGQDPLKVRLAGEEFDIMYFAFSGPSRLGLQESVAVFVRGGAQLDLGISVDLFKRFEGLFRDLAVAMEIRNDAWFVYQQGYPFVNPFNEDRSVPFQKEYNASPAIKCVSGPEGPRCEVVNL